MTRNERAHVRYIDEWNEPFVHRSWDSEVSLAVDGARVVLCYGRLISPVDYVETDEPVTCLACIGLPLDTKEVAPLKEMHRRPGYTLDPKRRFKVDE